MSDLNWNDKNLKPIDFIEHYWKSTENIFSQFSQGQHTVTKAYESNNDYLGFTDDYDFCWGPNEEGGDLINQEYPIGWDKDEETNIEYTTQDYGYNEYSDRLWGVYTKTAGEIYLLKANENLTDWDKHEQLLFAPSGSKNASIEFNKNGQYEVAVEIEPSGTDIKEIWVMSYPYEGDSIRKISNGSNPQLVMNHNKDLILLYTNQEKTKILYRVSSENYSNEYEINNIYEPERKLNLRYAYKIFNKREVGKFNTNLDFMPVDYKGKLIVFYKRDDDYKPYKYTLTEELYHYIFRTLLKQEEDNNIEIYADNTLWKDMRYLITILSSPNSEIYIKGQKDQKDINTILNDDGEDSFKIIPYNTVYDVIIEKDGQKETGWSILIYNNDDTKEMDIELPFLNDRNRPIENNNINFNLSNLVWELAGVDLNIYVFNQENLSSLGNSTITIKGQKEQKNVSGITDSSGNVTFNDILPYETIYDIVIENDVLGTNNSIGLLNNFSPGTEQNIDLPFITPFKENISSINFTANTIWEIMYITTTITLKDLAGNILDSASIIIKAQRDMNEINLTTDSNGEATVDLFVYDTAYKFEMSKTGYETEKDLWHLVTNTDSKSRNIDMYISDGEFDREENSNLGFNIESILWLEV